MMLYDYLLETVILLDLYLGWLIHVNPYPVGSSSTSADTS